MPMPRGHAYLIAVMDWHTRAVLSSWEVCDTMDTAFCLRVLRKAFKATGRQPKIFKAAN
ncbi:MAG: transposase family protein [Rubritalea sp.]|uniref:transposase family protein n=1 Tax=Rubritalea sp. TaxID=2109375 RepID=UPI003242EA37